ncbi:MAG TPA: type II toxin-antitoxin system VapC family toxin [Bryobacteraceae bacterium]|jgi:ribonuclease VapC|nr:type II toxin-antitoxin system VapC family toxin [Bryobacteraceae bacterium]
MVIDTSAILAILQRESERRPFLEAIEQAESVRMSVASFVESSIVIEARYGPEGLHDLDRFLSRAGVEMIPVDMEQGQLARSAFSRFGKGRHRAGLNYGDCFSYAAAIALGEPLLCKGDDFIHTDVPQFDVRNS